MPQTGHFRKLEGVAISVPHPRQTYIARKPGKEDEWVMDYSLFVHGRSVHYEYQSPGLLLS